MDPVRIDHVKRTLRSVVLAATGGVVATTSVVWAEQGIPREPRPLVAMSLVSGPSKDGQLKDDTVRKPDVTRADVALLSVVAGETYRVYVNRIPFEVTAGGGSTLAGLRNSLVAQVNNTATPMTPQKEPVQASAGVGAGDIVLVPTEPGGIYSVDATPGSVMSVALVEDADQIATHVLGRRRLLFTVDVYTAGVQAFELGARGIADKIFAAFDTDATLELTEIMSVPLRTESEVRNLTALESGGAVFEQRANFDVSAHITSRVAVTTGHIETVEVTAIVGSHTDVNTFTL